MSFSLRWLLIAIACIGLFVVAMLNANPYWVKALRGAVVIALSVGIAASVVSIGRERAFWIGASLVGWIYLLSPVLDAYPLFQEANVDGVAGWIHSKIVTRESVTVNPTPVDLVRGQFVLDHPPLAVVKVVWHCGITAVVALLGGYITRWFYSRRDLSKERSGQ